MVDDAAKTSDISQAAVAAECDAEYRNRFEFFKIAYETRNMELRLFWERANYFLALNSGIALGFFSIDSERVFSRFFLSLIGIVVSFLWVRTNLGSKFWQARWESRLRTAEKELGPPIELFSENWKKMVADATAELEVRRKSRIDKFVNRAILTKPSVTRTMIVLSVWSVIFWFVASVTTVLAFYFGGTTVVEVVGPV